MRRRPTSPPTTRSRSNRWTRDCGRTRSTGGWRAIRVTAFLCPCPLPSVAAHGTRDRRRRRYAAEVSDPRLEPQDAASVVRSAAAVDDVDAPWETTIERIRDADAEPFRVSGQLAFSLFATLLGAVQAADSLSDGAWWVVLLDAVGIATAWSGWAWARSRGRLQPWLPAPWAVVVNALRPTDRRRLRRMLAGRVPPASDAQRALVVFLVQRGREANRSSWMPATGVGLVLAGNALRSEEPWIPWGYGVSAALLVVGAVIAWRRRRRVRRVLGDV
jgi:hypothetical protein